MIVIIISPLRRISLKETPGNRRLTVSRRACRMHSVQESLTEARVPNNSRYYSLTSSMSAVTVIYLNRFLAELLVYISGLFGLYPTPLFDLSTPGPPQKMASASSLGLGGESSRSAQHAATAAAAAALAAATARPQAFMLLLDVHMEAPVIEMPRHSESADSLEVDLGVLDLSNAITFTAPVTAGAMRPLVDRMQFHLHQVRPPYSSCDCLHVDLVCWT